ncbi:MAG: 3-hydroxyacyl-CoA dehydrogenase NAD-binding domain-containing protein [Sphingomonadales bacterium]
MKTPESIETLTVVGAGAMGRGIAYCGVAAGYKVTITDSNAAQIADAFDWISQRAAKDGVVTDGLAAAQILADACADADIVIEAVVEKLEIKADVFRVAAAASAHAVLASNTSGIPVSRIGEAAGVPERVVGMHFFNPVPRMRLCEIVVGDKTADEAVAVAEAVAHRMGKTPVRTGDTPGFLASRLNCAVGNEALRMLEQGVASAEAIDTAVKLGLNYPMGPLELLDLVGLDVRLNALQTLDAAFGGGFAPTELHRKLVERGRLGRKTRAGIYDYDEAGQKTGAGVTPDTL